MPAGVGPSAPNTPHVVEISTTRRLCSHSPAMSILMGSSIFKPHKWPGLPGGLPLWSKVFVTTRSRSSHVGIWRRLQSLSTPYTNITAHFRCQVPYNKSNRLKENKGFIPTYGAQHPRSQDAKGTSRPFHCANNPETRCILSASVIHKCHLLPSKSLRADVVICTEEIGLHHRFLLPSRSRLLFASSKEEKCECTGCGYKN